MFVCKDAFNNGITLITLFYKKTVYIIDVRALNLLCMMVYLINRIE